MSHLELFGDCRNIAGMNNKQQSTEDIIHQREKLGRRAQTPTFRPPFCRALLPSFSCNTIEMLLSTHRIHHPGSWPIAYVIVAGRSG